MRPPADANTTGMSPADVNQHRALEALYQKYY